MRRSLFALLLLTGCTAEIRAARQAALNTTIGMDEPTLVRTVGVPTRTLDTEGHRFLAYSDQRVDYVPTFGAYGGYGRFGFYNDGFVVPEARNCETTYELDAGRVTSWAQRGNACDYISYSAGVPAPPPKS
jgi:hypothetical protein